MSYELSMDSIKSSLNPYAAPFVPSSKPAGVLEEDGNLGNLSCVDMVDQGKPTHTSFGNTQCTGELHVFKKVSSSIPTGACDVKLQEHHSEKSSVEFETQDMLDKFDLVSDILCNEFPDLSKESIAEVFYANACDMEETVNMLEALEDQNTGSDVVDGPNTSGTVGVKDEA